MEDFPSVDWEMFLDWPIDDTLNPFPGNIVDSNEKVKGHTPRLVSRLKSDLPSTTTVPNHVGVEIEGTRVLYHLILFPKLNAITKLVGHEFLNAWWATAKSHLALWQNGIYHRDISPSNLVYYEMHGKTEGVLIDFDLASTEDGPTRTERTGTIPFMALALLHEKSIRKKIKHSYHHDAESFIWTLTWITLRYDDGSFRTTARPLDEWLRADASMCVDTKCGFLFSGDYMNFQGGGGHEQNWQVAKECLEALGRWVASIQFFGTPISSSAVDEAFQKLLYDLVAPFLSSTTDS